MQEYAYCKNKIQIKAKGWKPSYEVVQGVYEDKQSLENWHACYIHIHQGRKYLFDPNETTRYTETRFFKDIKKHVDFVFPLKRRPDGLGCLQDINGNAQDMKMLSKGVCVAIAHKIELYMTNPKIKWEDKLNYLCSVDPTEFYSKFKL